MSIIGSEVSSRFAIARRIHSKVNPVTGDMRIEGLIDLQVEEKIARRALLAQEYFSEYGPPEAPQLPLVGEEMLRLAKTGDLGLAVASYAWSLERNEWDIQKHPSFPEYVSGLLSLPTLRLPYGGFHHPDKIGCWYGPYPLRGLRTNGIWQPPVH